MGIPWRGNQDIVFTLHLRLDCAAPKLFVETRRGRALFGIDTRTYRVSRSRTLHRGSLLQRFSDDLRLRRPRKSIQRLVCRLTYSQSTIERGFSYST
jgi:hypothetical protein